MKNKLNIKEIICDRRFWMLTCYVIAVIALAYIHEPWFDELQAWYLAVVNSPVGLWKAMAAEGHFSMWHFLLFPLVKMGVSSKIGLPLVSCSLMIFAAWLLIYKSPFRTWVKVFILISFPFLCFYPIVSRCYALIPPLMFLLAIYYPKRNTHPIAYGIILGLLYNTHMYMEGFTITMTALWGYELYKSHNKRQIIGLAITLVLGLIAFLQVAEPVFSICTDYTHAFHDPRSIRVITEEIVSAWTPLVPAALDSKFVWCIPYLHPILKWSLLLAVIFLNVWVLKSNRKMLWILIISWVYMLVFAYYIYTMSMQRTTLPFFIAIFCLWVGNIPKRKVLIYTAVFGLSMFVATIVHIDYDFKNPYDGYYDVRCEMDKDNGPDMYIYRSSQFARLPILCFGSDTLAKSNRFVDNNDLYNQVTKQNHSRCVVYVMNDDWAHYKNFKKQTNGVVCTLDSAGYTLVDTMPNFKFFENYAVRYTFEKREEK